MGKNRGRRQQYAAAAKFLIVKRADSYRDRRGSAECKSSQPSIGRFRETGKPVPKIADRPLRWRAASTTRFPPHPTRFIADPQKALMNGH
jgi:hypothetical protein